MLVLYRHFRDKATCLLHLTTSSITSFAPTWLPSHTYRDGEIGIEILKLDGDYAICSQIFLYEYAQNE